MLYDNLRSVTHKSHTYIIWFILYNVVYTVVTVYLELASEEAVLDIGHHGPFAASEALENIHG